MKILHVLSSNKFSGAENLACQIIEMMKEIPELEMAYCSPDGDIRYALKDRNVNYIPISSISKKEIKKVLELYRPDVIHAHDMRASYICARACGRVPLISHIHNNAFDSQRISIKSIAYLFAAYKAKKIFWVSSSSQSGYRFSYFVRSKSSVLHNVIDIDALKRKIELDPNDYKYDIVYLGRLSYEKNPLRLLNVMTKVIKANPTIKLAIIGSGALEEELIFKCKDLRLDDNVEFLGFQNNPYKILSQSKVMVMTSLWEGLPMCAMEALSLGVPIVSTPTDGLKDIIISGVNGYLSDDDSEIAEKIVDIISDENIRESLSNNAIFLFNDLNNIIDYRTKLLETYNSNRLMQEE